MDKWAALLYEAEYQRELDCQPESCLGSACCPECGVPRDGYLMLDGSWHRGCMCHEERS